MKKTIDMLEKVLGDSNSQNVDLIVIRVSASTSTQKPEDFQQRVVSITQRIMQLKSKIYSQDKFHKFLVIVNDNVEAAWNGHADGVHVKEKMLILYRM
jgi:thiamine monophosphate synthase